jgi:hypothetical protein
MKIQSIRRVVRLVGLVLPLSVLSGMLAAQAKATATAESYAVAVRTATVDQKTTSAVLPSDGGTVQNSSGDVSIGGLVTAQDAFATASGSSDRRQSAAAVSSATLGAVSILGGLITADGVVALASSTDANRDVAGSGLSNLVVNGVQLNDPAPNTQVDLPGVGYVVLNERTLSNDGAITVNMIHVVLQDLSGQTTGEIIVGSATAKVR